MPALEEYSMYYNLGRSVPKMGVTVGFSSHLVVREVGSEHCCMNVNSSSEELLLRTR